MSSVENLFVMGLEVSIDSAATDSPGESTVAEERDRALLALVERFGLVRLLEGIQAAAELAADAHDVPGNRDTCRDLRSLAQSISNARKVVGK